MRAGFDIGFYLLKQSPGSQNWVFLNTSPFSSAAGVHAASSILAEIYDTLSSLNIQIEEVIFLSTFLIILLWLSSSFTFSVVVHPWVPQHESAFVYVFGKNITEHIQGWKCFCSHNVSWIISMIKCFEVLSNYGCSFIQNRCTIYFSKLVFLSCSTLID